MSIVVKIVLFQEEQPQEDGSVLKPWVAALATHDLRAQGETARQAVRRLVEWARAAHDRADIRAALEHPEGLTKPPRDPEDSDWPFAPDMCTERGWREKGKNDPAWAAAIAAHDDPSRLVYDPMPPMYPPARLEVVARFEAAKPYDLSKAALPNLPAGVTLDVRIG